MNITATALPRESANYLNFQLESDGLPVGGMHQYVTANRDIPKFHAWLTVPYVATSRNEVEGQGFGETQAAAIQRAFAEIERQISELNTNWAALKQRLAV